MIASLRDADIDLLCHGTGDWGSVRSGGLVSCHVSLDPTSVDIGTLRMDLHQSEAENRPRRFNTKPLVVDFLVTRNVGVAFRLHPNNNDNKIICKVSSAASTPAPIPGKGGIYGTDGPGTFKTILIWNQLPHLRFDMAAVKKAQAAAPAQVIMDLLRTDATRSGG